MVSIAALNVLHPLFCWLECFTLLPFTKIAETSASPSSIRAILYESQIYKQYQLHAVNLILGLINYFPSTYPSGTLVTKAC